MRILFTIPHYFNADDSGRHGSQRQHARPRLQALTLSLAALHQLFSKSQAMIDVNQRAAHPANHIHVNDIDVVICTTQGHHLLDVLSLPDHFYRHHPTQVNPRLLGFECQAVLRDCLGQYDYYCFLEDDLILHDPWFFIKLDWFTQQAGPLSLLQPNRYEAAIQTLMSKVYLDGNLSPTATAAFQNVDEIPHVQAFFLGRPLTFHRACNPHSGCYFLNQIQMEHWVSQPYFLDRDTRFIGPLESAATLGIMKTFRVYKSVPQQASFLEIQHFGRGFLMLLGTEIELMASSL